MRLPDLPSEEGIVAVKDCVSHSIRSAREE